MKASFFYVGKLFSLVETNRKMKRELIYKVTKIVPNKNHNAIHFVPKDKPRENELVLNEGLFDGEIIFHDEPEESNA